MAVFLLSVAVGDHLHDCFGYLFGEVIGVLLNKQ